jgi:hypothetical protein
MARDESETPAPIEGGGEEREYQEERWVYLGVRQGRGSTTYYAWRDEAGDELGYDKVKARVFGGIHTVQVSRIDERVTVRSDTVRFTGDRADDAAAIEINALQRERELALIRLERNAKRTKTIDDALTSVLEIAQGLKTYSDRRALLDYISSKVHSA